MALIFLGVPIVFNVFSFKFHQVNRPQFIANNEWSAVHPTSIHWIIRLGGNAGVLLQAATEAGLPMVWDFYRDSMDMGMGTVIDLHGGFLNRCGDSMGDF